MPNNRETVAIVHEALEAANRIVTHLSVAGCLVGAGRPPRGTAKAPMVEYQFARVALWMRRFADELPKFDRAIELPGESIAAVSEAVVAGQFHVDPLRIETSLSATAKAVVLIRDAKATGYGLLRYVVKIVGSDARGICHPDTLRDHAAKLEALEFHEKWLAYDDMLVEISRQIEEAKPLNARWRELHLPLEVERITIAGESKPTESMPDGERACRLMHDNDSLKWPEVARIIMGEMFDRMNKDDQARAVARISKAARDYGKRTENKLEKKLPGRPRLKKSN